MALQPSTPAVKLELSPAESLLSVAGDGYSSLFSSAASPSVATPATMNPMDMMTPSSSADDSLLAALSDEQLDDDCEDGEEKKQTKKRKSWGQVLPEPKTNLPPRKRAKTDDEKEQRRVERVLRNRRAAQSSRERKRLEVEALEKRNEELETLLLNAQKANLLLVEELNRFRRDSGVVTRTSSPLDTLRDNNITLSPELFSSQAANGAVDQSGNALVDDLILTNPTTVNPASLSPSLGPVPDNSEAMEEETSPNHQEAQSTEKSAITSPVLTQHPAEMLSDLPCHTSAEVPKTFLEATTPQPLTWFLQLRMLLLSASAILSVCQRPLTQIAMSSKAGFSLLPTPQLLTTIIWLVTLPPASRINQTSNSSTSTTSSTTRQAMSPLTLWQRATMPLRTTGSTSNSTTLRLKSLRKILSSSPLLARPLMDATLVALRLVSEELDDRVVRLSGESSATREQDCELTKCLRGINLPSREALLTLLWALKVEDQKRSARQQRSIAAATHAPVNRSPEQSTTYVLKVAGQQQKKQQQQRMKFQENNGVGKRRYRLRR